MKYNELPRVTSLGLNKLLPLSPLPQNWLEKETQWGEGGHLLVQEYSDTGLFLYADRGSLKVLFCMEYKAYRGLLMVGDF